MRFTELVKVFFQRVLVPFHWLFVRLPRAFSMPLLAVALLYFFFLFPLLVNASAYLVIHLVQYVADHLTLMMNAYTGTLPKLLSVIAGLIFLDIVLIAS